MTFVSILRITQTDFYIQLQFRLHQSISQSPIFCYWKHLPLNRQQICYLQRYLGVPIRTKKVCFETSQNSKTQINWKTWFYSVAVSMNSYLFLKYFRTKIFWPISREKISIGQKKTTKCIQYTGFNNSQFLSLRNPVALLFSRIPNRPLSTCWFPLQVSTKGLLITQFVPFSNVTCQFWLRWPRKLHRRLIAQTVPLDT